MAKFTQLSRQGFWIGTILLFGVVFFINRGLYVMPDAVSMSIGGMVGAYLFGWLVWVVVRWKMQERAPEPRHFIFVLACISVAVTMLPHVAKLFA